MVVGGGVIGCAVLYELTRRGVQAVLVEAQSDLGEGASKANSAIVHTGFDTKPGTIEARLVARARALWPELAEALSVPFVAVGALMVARTVDEQWRLTNEVQVAASANGVATSLIQGAELRQTAPYLHPEVIAALSIPGESIVDPFWLTRAYAEAALAGGAQVITGRPVIQLTVSVGSVDVLLADRTSIVAEQVFDCAGLQADILAATAGDGTFQVSPRKGQFLVSEESYGVDRIVLPIPGPMGKGMLLTPIVFGGLLLGPTAVDQVDKDDRSTDASGRRQILEACRQLVPALDQARPIRAFAGLRTVSSTGDYILRPSAAGDRLWIVAGIRSTGVTASPAVAELVVHDALRARGWSPAAGSVKARQSFLDAEAGEIVCLCRSVGRGEVLAACRAGVVPTTLDAVKRRSGVAFGDCQGNQCLPQVATILAAERGLPVPEINKSGPGSWLFVAANNRPTSLIAELQEQIDALADVVIVGGGHAGRAAQHQIARAGLNAIVVDRCAVSCDSATMHGTAVGLVPEGAAWRVLVQAERGAWDLRSAAVILATGGYVEPREHRAISGPRPSGIFTADLVDIALAQGLLPGRRIVVVGGGLSAARIATALLAYGAEAVDQVDVIPDEVRGLGRLEAVHVGDRWIACDTLVMADRLLAQPFLLRSLGLVDSSAGGRAMVSDDGRLSMPGLWAVGCCAAPDIDHLRCADSGRRVGDSVAASLV